MTINSTKTQLLLTLWNNSQINSNNVLSQFDKKNQNAFLKEQALKLLTVLPKVTVESTKLEHINELLENDEIKYLYKEWEITISDFSTIDAETLIDFIIPYMKCEIVYEEGQENDVDFYNAELDLQQTSFWEIKNDLLIFHVSVYIRKYFGGEALIPPQAKVMLTFQNPLEVMN